MNRIDGIKKHKKFCASFRSSIVKLSFSAAFLRLGCLFVFACFLSACSELEKPTPEPFYSETAPPQKKEFRWSNGKLPKSFDPALALASPETDVVRALFEGLTDTDPKTLKAIPAIASDWTASEDFKTWTFKLRQNAHWSNNERVTANDFVRSWKRLAEKNKKASASYKLVQNIVGMQAAENTSSVVSEDVDKVLSKSLAVTVPSSQFLNNPPNSNTSPQIQPKLPDANKKISPEQKKEVKVEPKFGVEAVDNFTLKVSLINPDKDFPSLAAHPIFRPVYGDGKDLETDKLNAAVITNGAFRIFSIGPEGVTLDRAETFWNKDAVELERVRFVPIESAEKALEAYRKGEVDAVTNAEFEPLALKLLTPYDDFQRTTHSALNFYEFNRSKKPFDDRRVREALTISIERERLTESDMEGATTPALRFLPFADNSAEPKLAQNLEKAKNLLTEAGFPGGENFPVMRLVVNRNEIQQRIARSVAKMWRQNLNIETEVVVKESAEIETAKVAGDFDLIRRGEVLPTTDEATNMLTIFPPPDKLHESLLDNKTAAATTATPPASEENKDQADKEHEPAVVNKSDSGNITGDGKTGGLVAAKPSEESPISEEEGPPLVRPTNADALILTEAEAMEALPAIPLYFSTSYSLVKPYIHGFEINTLDAPSLKDVRIDNTWQPKKVKGES